jgi:hypothetical protein
MRCLFYAIKKYRNCDGYIVFRRTKILRIPFPHFLWLPPEYGKYLESFVPVESHKKHKFLPPLWFKGYIKKGDS